MFFNIILLFTVLILLTVFLTYSKDFKEKFLDFPDGAHKTYIEESKTKINELTNMVDLTDPSIPVTQSSANTIKNALIGLESIETPTIYSLESNNLHNTLSDIPDGIKKAKQCQAAPPTCAAFDDTTFASNCGMSFDIKGTGLDDKPFTGGLLVIPQHREKQTKDAEIVKTTHSAPYDPYRVYQPTLGTAKPGTFALTKDQCIVVKERVDCAKKQTFNSPNCTQCYTSQDFARVDPQTGRLPSTLYLFGTGTITVTSTNKSISLPQTNLDLTKPAKVTLPSDSEGSTFIISFSANSNPPPAYIGGYLEGPTARGAYKIDIMNLIQSDTVTNTKPRLSGTKTFNKFRCLALIPGNGKTTMSLACLMPFTFINMYDADAMSCDNGPIVTKESSATFLQSDPCFSKGNAPGNYKLECLQNRWVELGGTMQGTGYPSTQAKADALQKDVEGNPLAIDDIVDILAVKMGQALSGRDANGKFLSIPAWNEVSMYATGVPINTPCDGPGGIPPLSVECLSYLYNNKGTSSQIGPTYTQPASRVGHFKGEAFVDTPSYNYNGTPLDPRTSQSSLEFSQKIGGVNAVKQTYDNINRLANDNTKVNSDRSLAIQQAYGVTLNTANIKNDFDVRVPANVPTKSYADLKAVCESKGQRLCESTEICDMRTRQINNPELTSSFPGDNWIAVSDSENEWLTLNQAGGRYCKTHTEVAGGTPAWGSTREAGGWERLAKCCGGVGEMQGRYIKLQYNHVECLNLAQIQVYTTPDDSSMITIPASAISKSSGYATSEPHWNWNANWWWGGWWSVWYSTNYDTFPNQNVVDGGGNSFVHSSCGDVPWLQVDLGGITPIYKVVVTNRHDCCQERVLGTTMMILNTQLKPVYTSVPITTINTKYIWFPPSTAYYGDYSGSAPPTPGYKHIGCWGDTGNRAITPLDGSDPSLTDNYQARTDAINKCYNVAKAKGLKYFGVQDGGWCAGTNDLQGAKRYGPSKACRAGGKGGGWANDVYEIGDV